MVLFNVVSSLTFSTLLECASYCSMRDVCTAFHFDKPSKNCSLGSKEYLIPTDSIDTSQSIAIHVDRYRAIEGKLGLSTTNYRLLANLITYIGGKMELL